MLGTPHLSMRQPVKHNFTVWCDFKKGQKNYPKFLFTFDTFKDRFRSYLIYLIWSYLIYLIINQVYILQINDYVILQNFLFAYDHFHNTLPPSLQNIFILVENIHEHNTRNSNLKCLSLPSTKTIKYGINSIKYQSIYIYGISS